MIDNEGYIFSDKIFLRLPFYSFSDYAPAKLAEVLSDAAFRDALWLASTGFYRLVEKKEFRLELLDEKERFTLLKYYNRMSFRATPFGAFASFTVLGWSDGGAIRLPAGKAALLHLLPSLRWLQNEAGLREATGEERFLALNPTLYRLGASWRFTQSVRDDSGRLFFSLCAVDAGKINNKLIRMAGEGPVARCLMQEELVSLAGCSAEDAGAYLDFLSAEQVLLDSQEVHLLAGEGSLGYTCADSRTFAFWKENARINFPGGERLPLLAARLPVAEGAANPQPFYANLERPALSGGMPAVFRAKLQDAAGLLERIVPAFPLQALSDFRRAFLEKFDAQKVPLLKALDPDTGVSYGSLHRDPGTEGILDGLPFPERGLARDEVQWSVIHRMFLKIWLENNNRKISDPVVIRDSDVAQLPELNGDKTSPGLALLFGRSGDKLVLESCGGVSSTALIGRFSAFSAAAHRVCQELATAEAAANPGVVFAEIHQLSHDQVDNVNRRRQVFDYVIPLNTFPCAADGKYLLPADLLLSVKGEELLLESISLGKRVIPRLPTAYNHHHNDLALFRMLCDLQYQGLRANLSFDPEKLFPGLAFYPRIEYRDVVISLARWHLRKEEFEMLAAKPFSLGRLHLFRQERGIPRMVSMGRSDQQLVFDLAHDEEALFFLENLKDSGEAVLREYLVPDGLVTAGQKTYSWQGLALLTAKQPAYAATGPGGGVRVPPTERVFLPGSEWLYLKIYCTAQSADLILREVVLPELRQQKSKVLSWFFIRYQEGGHHIRLRIRMAEADTAALLAAFRKSLLRRQYKDLVRDYRNETYYRELERYGAAYIEQVEACFYQGSRCAMAFLNAGVVHPPAGIPGLEPFALAARMCAQFLKSPGELLPFLAGRAHSFLAEFNGGERLKLGFDRKYRSVSTALGHLLESKDCTSLPGGRVTTAFLESLAGLAFATAAEPAENRHKLLADLVHLQVNRLYFSRQRQYEGLIWYCLHKYTVSQQARIK